MTSGIKLYGIECIYFGYLISLTLTSKTQNTEEAIRKCPDITDRLRLLEQEVARNREESGKSKAEVERLMAALRDAEMEKLCKEKKIADLER